MTKVVDNIMTGKTGRSHLIKWKVVRLPLGLDLRTFSNPHKTSEDTSIKHSSHSNIFPKNHIPAGLKLFC